MKKTLLIVYESTHFAELLRVAHLLKQTEDYEPFFYFAISYPRVEEHHALCFAESIVCLDAEGERMTPERLAAPKPPSPPPPAPPPKRSIPRKIYNLLLRILNEIPPFRQISAYRADYQARVASYDYLYRQARDRSQRVIAEYRPDILIFAEDNVERWSAVWVQTGHRHGVPSAIVPYTIANATEPAEAYLYYDEFSLRRLDNLVMGLRYPRWVYTHKRHRMVRMPAPAIAVHERAGTAPPIPWLLNSGYTDAIAVENEAMRDYYLKEGLPQAQLVTTGALYDDVLAERLQHAAVYRAEVYEKLNLPPDHPMILCALPPNQNERLQQQVCDFTNYDDLVAFWMQTLAACSDQHNVVINLHPSLDYESMRDIERWGVKIARQSIAELTPLCDIFVASVSATIRLAIACGKPVINYDVFRYGYADYAQAGGVLTFEEQHEFVEAVQRLTTDPAFYAQVKARQEQVMQRWGMLDGKSGERMLNLFDRLIAEAQTGKAPADREQAR